MDQVPSPGGDLRWLGASIACLTPVFVAVGLVVLPWITAGVVLVSVCVLLVIADGGHRALRLRDRRSGTDRRHSRRPGRDRRSPIGLGS